jgi:thiamine-phosphate pyrophosphorylase
LCLPKPQESPTPASGPVKSRALLLCYITDRGRFAGNAAEQTRQLLAKITECAAAGVDFIQLREKDLSPRKLETLALQAVAALPPQTETRLLINSRVDVALACGAHGVHLPAGELWASEARALWGRASQRACIVGVSAHSVAEIALAESHGADFAVFGPVFEKAGAVNPNGLEQLQQACRRLEAAVPPMPVLALGGVTVQNATQCLAAGCAGVAGIRLFQDMNASTVVTALRSQFANRATV